MATRKLEPLQVVVLYTSQHLTCEEIGKLHGVSRAAVYACLKRAGVTREQGSWVDVVCAFCGTPGRKRRRQWRQRLQNFCNQECYFASLEAHNYRPWRQGSRIARALVAQLFPLQIEHIVHHKDGDNHNNDRANLAVYASQADHMAHHRGRKVEPLWDGAAQ